MNIKICKLQSILLVFVLIVSVFAGCTAKDNNSSGVDSLPQVDSNISTNTDNSANGNENSSETESAVSSDNASLNSSSGNTSSNSSNTSAEISTGNSSNSNNSASNKPNTSSNQSNSNQSTSSTIPTTSTTPSSSSSPSSSSTPLNPSTPSSSSSPASSSSPSSSAPVIDLGDMTATSSGASGVEKVTFLSAIGASEYVRPNFKTAKDGLNYAYYKPTTAAPAEGYPLVIFLHGNGSAGGTFSVDRVLGNDNCQWWWNYNFDLLKNAVIIAPHCTSTGSFTLSSYWNSSDQAVSLVKKIISNSTYGKINANRVYLVGFSAGAIASYREIANNPNLFAAAVPVAGAASSSIKKENLKKTPIWGWHGKDDPTVKYSGFILGNATSQIFESIKSGGLMRFTTVSNGDHHSPLYKALADRHVWSWVFAQDRSKNQTTDYTVKPYLRVEDSNGKTVFSELDASAVSYNNSLNQMELTMTSDGRNKLSEAYKASNGKAFNVYFGSKKIATYTATSGLNSNVTKFVLKGVFSSGNYTEYLNKLKFNISNKKRTSLSDTVNRGFPGGKFES